MTDWFIDAKNIVICHEKSLKSNEFSDTKISGHRLVVLNMAGY